MLSKIVVWNYFPCRLSLFLFCFLWISFPCHLHMSQAKTECDLHWLRFSRLLDNIHSLNGYLKCWICCILAKLWVNFKIFIQIFFAYEGNKSGHEIHEVQCTQTDGKRGVIFSVILFSCKITIFENSTGVTRQMCVITRNCLVLVLPKVQGSCRAGENAWDLRQKNY